MSYTVQSLKTLDVEAVSAFYRKSRFSDIYHEFTLMVEPEQDFSIAVTERDKIIALCPLIIEQQALDNETLAFGSFFGLSLPGPVFSDEITSEKLMKRAIGLIFEQIDETARNNRLAKVTYNMSNYIYDEARTIFLYNEMKRNNYLDASLQMIHLGLAEDPDSIMRNFSKGHRAAIKRFLGYEVVFENMKDIPLNIEEFREKLGIFDPVDMIPLLFRAYQREALEFCYLLHKREKIASSIFLKYNGVILYFAATRMIESELPVHHIILWKAILHYHAQAFRILDFGVIVGGPYLNYMPTEKQQMISRFKKGFGGKFLPFVCGEKYFSKSFFKKEYEKRIHDFMMRFIDA